MGQYDVNFWVRIWPFNLWVSQTTFYFFEGLLLGWLTLPFLNLAFQAIRKGIVRWIRYEMSQTIPDPPPMAPPSTTPPPPPTSSNPVEDAVKQVFK